MTTVTALERVASEKTRISAHGGEGDNGSLLTVGGKLYALLCRSVSPHACAPATAVAVKNKKPTSVLEVNY